MTKENSGSSLQTEGFKYETVIERGKPVHEGDYFSVRHPEMDHGRRAKIFAPFAALKGFEEEVQSKQVRYEPKRDLDPDELYELNDALNRLADLQKQRKKNISVSAEYYRVCGDLHSDAYGCMGTYVTVTGTFLKLDPVSQILRIGEEDIPFSLLYRVIIL